MNKNSMKHLFNIKWYFRLFLVVALIASLIGSIFHCISHAKKQSTQQLHEMSNQIEKRVSETIGILSAVRADNFISDTSRPLSERAQILKPYSKELGYLIMGITDEDINVYSTNDKSGNLARRTFMQEMYANGENQVTDVYSAGEDGSLLIYTIAVPILHENHVVGSVWASLGKDELDQIVQNCEARNPSDIFVIFGSNNSVLSASEEGIFGMELSAVARSSIWIGEKVENVETNLQLRKPGQYLGLKNGALWYVSYQGIKGTGWSVMYRCNVLTLIGNSLLSFFPLFLLIIIGGLMIDRIICKCLNENLSAMERTMTSIQAMNQKISGDGEFDAESILDITSRGLIDTLTGTVTRAVFGSSISARLDAVNPNKVSVLCFVDLDNLKTLNDNYGHDWGDKALSRIGHILRTYEKSYGGLAARYGGDEFILFLPDLKSRDEVAKILQRIINEVHFELKDEHRSFMVHCSIGAALYTDQGDSVPDLIAKADQALYKAKHRGKDTYNIFEEN